MVHCRVRKACFYVVLLVLAMSLVGSAYSEAQERRGEGKVSPSLKKVLATAGESERVPVIILLEKNDTILRDIEGSGVLMRRYRLVNAVSAELTPEETHILENNSNIKRIYYDEKIDVPKTSGWQDYTPYANSDSIGASYVRNNLNYTGRNVTVAVIDTGIDYTHPDLGGCLGSNCKVAGGYDFVNDDADPMDDNGHGTHCAGIIAANGGVMGVAPDARLLAVKVCSYNSCSNSALMAGIDWAVAHGADVISLSVGSNEQPSDGYAPLEMIIDAAVDRGVLVVVAAGNEGPGAGTIVDTASARKAISVGADNDKGTVSPEDDAVPDWSCRGPSVFGRFGPDVIAPGVNIYSTKAGGGYIVMGGTSMAAPHVAGAAALLKEYDRSLTPTQIKSLLIHTAANVSGGPFERGAGLINVTHAIESKLDVSVDGEDVWEDSVVPGMNQTTVIRMKSRHSSQINLGISAEPFTDSEGDYSINNSFIDLPNNVSLDGGEEKSFKITLHYTENIRPGTYGSILTIKGGGENTRIPIALTIPLLGSGMIQGSVDDECTGGSPDTCGINPSGSVGRWGDWRFYRIMNINGTSVQISLDWSDSRNDLDLYVFAPDGVLAAVSGQASTAEEHVSIDAPSYSEYWVAVYAYDLAQSKLWYNLSVSYPSSLSIQPGVWQGSVHKGENLSLDYTLVNDNAVDFAIVMGLKSVDYVAGVNVSNSIPYTGSNTFYVVWEKSMSGLDLADATHMNAYLRWSSASKDLDLYFIYNNGNNWNTSRFMSKHRNDFLGMAEESLTGIDIQYYLKTFQDVGIGISNPSDQESYSLDLSFTGEKSTDNGHATPGYISSLSAGEKKSIQVSIDTSALNYGETYDYYLTAEENGQEVARAPIRLTILENTQVTTTTTTTTTASSTTVAGSTTTTIQGGCTLAGDNPPCDVIEVSEIINLITAWTHSNASIADVIALINAWTGS